MQVQLLWVEGEDTEEFSDLIGSQGTLDTNADGLCFMPNDHNDWVTLAVKKTTEVGERYRVTTKLGNVFVFKKVNQK